MENNVIVIAEAGVNHNGDPELAMKLVDAAAAAGADFVKFQTFRADKSISRYAPKADYQQNNDPTGESQLEMVRKLELSADSHRRLQTYCLTKGIGFLSTPFDFESIELLRKLGITMGKIPSGELTNLPYLRRMAAAFPTLIVSTGMADMVEVANALDILVSAGADKKRITVLHCNTEYPTPMEDVNLLAMITMRTELQVRTGYSDHTQGIEVPIAAVALGAAVIEKHFTLDKRMKGPDHAASLDPMELATMVHAIRKVEAALGDGVKRPSPSEAKNIAVVRKSLVAAVAIRKGDIFTEGNVGLKRPGTGMSPLEWDSVIGRVSPRDFAEDEFISL